MRFSLIYSLLVFNVFGNVSGQHEAKQVARKLPEGHLKRQFNKAVRKTARKLEEKPLEKRAYDNSRATYFNVGLGACGEWSKDSEHIVALNVHQWDASVYPSTQCHKKITISYGGKTAQATIMDMCPSCPYGGLDLSPSLFAYFEPHSVGVFQMSWWFNGQSSPDPTTTTSEWVPPTTTTTRTTTTTTRTTTTTTTTTSIWVPPTTTTTVWTPPTTTTTTSVWVAPTTTTTTTTSLWVPPTTSSTTTTTSTSPVAPATTTTVVTTNASTSSAGSASSSSSSTASTSTSTSSRGGSTAVGGNLDRLAQVVIGYGSLMGGSANAAS